MDIAIYSAGLPHAEKTLEVKSMGGSETAALMVAKKLAALKHCVTLYSRLPATGEPDYIESGTIGEDGVRYRSIEDYPNCITAETNDLLIVSRDPGALNLPHQANKAVLWMHDLATVQLLPALGATAWNFDEIWTVSEFHRQQVHKLSGHPLERIVAMRNGIIETPEPEFSIERDPSLLYYGSRPERGLYWLVKPGGIMARLPEYRLQLSMYGDPSKLPEHIQAMYKQLFTWASQLPNVEMLGTLTQAEVRDKLREAAAWVYPTSFEETSCILAREAMSVGCPILASDAGALPETVTGNCGFLWQPPTGFETEDEYCQYFADRVRDTLSQPEALEWARQNQAKRTDLTWDGVAKMMEYHATTLPARPLLSRAKALVEVGDVIPAIALLGAHVGKLSPRAHQYLEDLEHRYETVMDPEQAQAAYQERYLGEKPTYGDLSEMPRYIAIKSHLASMNLCRGSVVLDYGCCEGNQIMNLARDFPHLLFVGYDFAPSTLQAAEEFAAGSKLTNVRFTTDRYDAFKSGADVVLLTEILEHQVEPWSFIDQVESLCEPGTRIITTTPIGPWEVGRLYANKNDYDFPEHLWHLDKLAMEQMVGRKKGVVLSFIPYKICDRTMLLLGNFFTSWEVDRRRKARALNALEKAETRAPRIQFCAVAAIAANVEHDILRMLKSCERAGIFDYSIALGPSQDSTAFMTHHFEGQRPWCQVDQFSVPAIEPRKVGFDDVRNMALKRVADDFDWVLWIDTDEELVEPQNVRRYLRNNHYDSYAIHQHHVSVDPRGGACQIDKPARFIRPARGFTFIGKIHEHAELGEANKGPGHAMILPNVDILHIGYKSEAVRRSRFARNFPFLVWDREVNPERKLGKYLWLRDLIHQMRYAHNQGDRVTAIQFAQEAVRFYDECWQDMAHFGNGVIQGFQYVSEARRYLQQGLAVRGIIQLEDGRQVELQGQIDDPEQLTRLITLFLKDECERSKSRYR